MSTSSLGAFSASASCPWTVDMVSDGAVGSNRWPLFPLRHAATMNSSIHRCHTPSSVFSLHLPLTHIHFDLSHFNLSLHCLISPSFLRLPVNFPFPFTLPVALDAGRKVSSLKRRLISNAVPLFFSPCQSREAGGHVKLSWETDLTSECTVFIRHMQTQWSLSANLSEGIQLHNNTRAWAETSVR